MFLLMTMLKTSEASRIILAITRMFSPKQTLISLQCNHSTAGKTSESVADLLLTRKVVARFVQHYIAKAENRQKHNADKNGRANVFFLMSEA